jgi:hypothetical protein
MSEESRGAGRPHKMANWLTALNEVIEKEDTMFLSDKDVLFLVNQKLPQEDRISTSTFQKWKAGKWHDESVAEQFMETLEFVGIKQKQALGQMLMTDKTNNWTRLAWTMERKFSDWNLKRISENININEPSTVIHITAGDDSQRQKIENLLNPNYKVVEPQRIESKPTNNEDDNDLPF